MASTLSGGSITGLGTGGNLNGYGSFSNVALSGLVSVQAGNSAQVSGVITNTGTLTIAGDNSAGYARLNLAGDTTLAGAGSTVLGTSSHGYYSTISNGAGYAPMLTIGTGHTVLGSGYIGQGDLNVINLGTVIADADSPLYLYSASTFDNTAGTLAVMSDSQLQLLSGTLLLGDASMLRFDVDTGASGAADAGQFTLAGDVSFDGTLALDLSDYEAQVGDSFTLLNFSGTAVASSTACWPPATAWRCTTT